LANLSKLQVIKLITSFALSEEGGGEAI
jgi:hypothetical protein